jgi:flagellar hook-associated protein FlgK
VNLMKVQQSYAAAARLVTIADEMAQRLVALGTQ